MSAVGATTHHGSLVHLHMADAKVLHVQTLRLTVGLQVVQKDQEELAGSLGPSALISRSLDGMSLSVTANTAIRQKMVDLINQVRLENGAAALTISDPLMDAAQDCASQCFTSHNNQYEGEAATNYGYGYGFGSNLTWFTARGDTDIAQTAVTNWVNSSGHFQTMVSTKYDCIGVGVCIRNNIAYCYMFAGNPNSVNAY